MSNFPTARSSAESNYLVHCWFAYESRVYEKENLKVMRSIVSVLLTVISAEVGLVNRRADRTEIILTELTQVTGRLKTIDTTSNAYIAYSGVP